jgi:hypothetical protein
MFEQKRPYKICRVGGKVFPIYLEYDEQLKESYPAYPDFTEHPEYTDEGRPFATAEQDSCSHGRSKVAGEEQPSDCGGCNWFHRERTPYDPIGVCMCDALRHKVQSELEETK